MHLKNSILIFYRAFNILMRNYLAYTIHFMSIIQEDTVSYIRKGLSSVFSLLDLILLTSKYCAKNDMNIDRD